MCKIESKNRKTKDCLRLNSLEAEAKTMRVKESEVGSIFRKRPELGAGEDRGIEVYLPGD